MHGQEVQFLFTMVTQFHTLLHTKLIFHLPINLIPIELITTWSALQASE